MQIPRKSGFEQVHRVSEFGGLNLVKTPFELNRWRGGRCISGGQRLAFAAMI